VSGGGAAKGGAAAACGSLRRVKRWHSAGFERSIRRRRGSAAPAAPPRGALLRSAALHRLAQPGATQLAATAAQLTVTLPATTIGVRQRRRRTGCKKGFRTLQLGTAHLRLLQLRF
jgi:hypothetical protein